MTANPLINGRNGGIRTHDPLTPRHVVKSISVAFSIHLDYTTFTVPAAIGPKESMTSRIRCKLNGA